MNPLIKRINASICEILKTTREELNLTQVEMAKAMLISQPYVSKLEQGKGQLTAPQYFWLMELRKKKNLTRMGIYI